MPEKYRIMRAIQEGLDNLDVTPRVDWTKVVLTKLCMMGQCFGFQVGAAKVDKANRNWGEWLYDVTWLEYNDAGRVAAAPLVAECEWDNFERIKSDFDKLLLARASVRLMIYDGNSKRRGSTGIAEELARRVREFTDSRAEDAWLLAAWERCASPAKENGEKDWRFRYFTIGRDCPIRAFP